MNLSPRIVISETKAEMKRVLENIQSGRFVRDFVLENKASQTSRKTGAAKPNTRSMRRARNAAR